MCIRYRKCWPCEVSDIRNNYEAFVTWVGRGNNRSTAFGYIRYQDRRSNIKSPGFFRYYTTVWNMEIRDAWKIMKTLTKPSFGGSVLKTLDDMTINHCYFGSFMTNVYIITLKQLESEVLKPRNLRTFRWSLIYSRTFESFFFFFIYCKKKELESVETTNEWLQLNHAQT